MAAIAEISGNVPGKKQSQRELWITTKLADALGLAIPGNAEHNFGKSQGFRKNIFKRIIAEASNILSPEELQRYLPGFMRESIGKGK